MMKTREAVSSKILEENFPIKNALTRRVQALAIMKATESDLAGAKYVECN